MLRRRRVDVVAFGVLAAAALAGVVLWPSLPERMVVHWDASGTPDNSIARPLAVFGLPAFGAATVLFTRLAPDSLTSTPGGENVAVLFVAGVLAVLQAAVYAWNLGYRFDIWLVVAPILVAAGALVWYASAR